ncbi:MAG: hypothetical protein AB8G18_12735 [Gammaproteobacteria bacterium]
MKRIAASLVAGLVTCAHVGAAELLDTINPDGIASIVGIGVDPSSGNLAVYGEFAGATITLLDQTGAVIGTLPSPGANSNDYDLDYALNDMVIDGVNIPSGSLLVFNGDDGPEKMYALDGAGTVLSTVNLASQSLVGGTHIPGTNTVATIDFASQDFIRILNANDGTELGFFSAGPQPFDIFYGDIDVSLDTNEITVVSSSQNVVRQLTPEGFCVRELSVDPFAISGMSGVAIDDSTGNLWISSTNGNIYHLDPRPDVGDTDGDGLLDFEDNCISAPNPAQDDSDGDGIGNSCDADIAGGVPGENDCVVNFLDLAALSEAFLSSPGSPNWNPDADIWGPGGEPDGVVNFLDVSRLPQLFLAVPGPSGRGNLCTCGL